ncbi:MAG TPA: pantetheine-phosphate adenylyltransferase [Flavobacteriales bacterium]|jgi:pantetheine-phosphate adenylyltransferase|nr:pantetheine-phosphate adenylyltransferase [Flavobacteriales bacterium]
MKKIAVFPGSFDPITQGHMDVILRAEPLFDKIVVALGKNTQKKYLYPLEVRMRQIRKVFEGHDKVEVASFSGLTIDYCKEINAGFLLRGIRTALDFDYERTIGLMNLDLAPDIETVYLISRPEYSAISSTVVREILRMKGDVTRFVPHEIIPLL